MMARRSSSLFCERWRSRTFFWSSERNDSMAALSAHAPTRPPGTLGDHTPRLAEKSPITVRAKRLARAGGLTLKRVEQAADRRQGRSVVPAIPCSRVGRCQELNRGRVYAQVVPVGGTGRVAGAYPVQPEGRMRQN